MHDFDDSQVPTELHETTAVPIVPTARIPSIPNRKQTPQKGTIGVYSRFRAHLLPFVKTQKKQIFPEKRAHFPGCFSSCHGLSYHKIAPMTKHFLLFSSFQNSKRRGFCRLFRPFFHILPIAFICLFKFVVPGRIINGIA